jgi:hypothetical protein
MSQDPWRWELRFERGRYFWMNATLPTILLPCPRYPAGAVWYHCYGGIPINLRHAWN